MINQYNDNSYQFYLFEYVRNKKKNQSFTYGVSYKLLDNDLINISDFDNLLPKPNFIRTHKSFIVAIDRIDEIKQNKIRMGETEIPIGKHYKKDVTQMVAAHRFNAEP